eukprot:351254-Chlamydomonas_euryale.AAC.3
MAHSRGSSLITSDPSPSIHASIHPGRHASHVGERRQFVVPAELSFKRKAFGQPVPQKRDALLFDVELLVIQPY